MSHFCDAKASLKLRALNFARAGRLLSQRCGAQFGPSGANARGTSGFAHFTGTAKGVIMKNIAYETVTAVMKSWRSKTRSFPKNSDFASMPAYKSIKKYEKVG